VDGNNDIKWNLIITEAYDSTAAEPRLMTVVMLMTASVVNPHHLNDAYRDE